MCRAAWMLLLPAQFLKLSLQQQSIFFFFPNQKDTWQQLLRHFVMEAHGPESPAALTAWSAPGDGKLVALWHFKRHLGHFRAL